ncbi:hypothetical protein IWX83_000020 [Flavobacterium sp. CG_9.1]|uniref:Uncharacterized protein n=1 Tax=Flavobacterium xanthum TaxID=69322 RepID=A0A1M7B754_9FLAO|nr:hypothetical protein [Flavobacterium sp. CG_9.1]SHL50822.1 hypothetical protein SAMN05443669_100892 [Flavobacterium xanthum]
MKEIAKSEPIFYCVNLALVKWNTDNADETDLRRFLFIRIKKSKF